MVNEAVFLLDDGADFDAVQSEIEAHMTAAFPETGVDFKLGEDDPGSVMLYSDAENDQVTWDSVALLFLDR